LNLPVVRLMRKEKDVVEFSKVLKAKEAAMVKRIHELDHKLNSVDQDQFYMRRSSLGGCPRHRLHMLKNSSRQVASESLRSRLRIVLGPRGLAAGSSGPMTYFAHW
jgi:hypothetical protein